MKLSRPQFKTGDEIELSIVAPYTPAAASSRSSATMSMRTPGSKPTRTSSVQHIRVPDDFEGTGYVNVSFIRALDSKEVFMSPAQLRGRAVSGEHRKAPPSDQLGSDAKKSRRRNPRRRAFRIAYKTDRPARIAIFAVDQGILQVSDYRVPDPLPHFFRKAALMVQTTQIVDLILPEFSILRERSAFGGDGEKRASQPVQARHGKAGHLLVRCDRLPSTANARSSMTCPTTSAARSR